MFFATKAFSYPKECTEIENKLIDLIAQANSGKDPSEEIGVVVPKLNSVTEKYPECKKTTIPLTRKLTSAIDEFIEREKAKDREENGNKTSTKVSYDEWFALQRTGIKSGKKYSFIACVNGVRNLTAIQCAVPGSAAKRVFYKTDDIKDIETKKKWVNTINKNKCVTAYVAGGEAFIVDLNEQNTCK